jgi:hypothetical protein
MYSYLLQQLASEVQRDRLRGMRRHTRPGTPAGRAGHRARRSTRGHAQWSPRQRAGWALVELGLRLAGTAGDA